MREEGLHSSDMPESNLGEIEIIISEDDDSDSINHHQRPSPPSRRPGPPTRAPFRSRGRGRGRGRIPQQRSSTRA